jgi:hypothetical protein
MKKKWNDLNNKEKSDIKKILTSLVGILIIISIINFLYKEFLIFDKYFFNEKKFKFKLLFKLRWYLFLILQIPIYYLLIPIIVDFFEDLKFLGNINYDIWWLKLIIGVVIIEILYLIFFQNSILYKGLKKDGFDEFRKNFKKKN